MHCASLSYVHRCVFYRRIFNLEMQNFSLENHHIMNARQPFRGWCAERESSKECWVSFLWTNESVSLWNCLSRNSTLFSTRRIGALGLFWTNQGSEVSDTWGTFRTLWSKKSTSLKKNFFLHFDIGVKEKPQNVHLKLIFCHVLDRFNLRERNDLTCLTRIAFYD